MKLIYREFSKTIDTDTNLVNVIVIENQSLFYRFLEDFYNHDPKIVIFSNEKEVPIEKNCEIINNFVPFDINSKSLTNKLASSIEKKISSSENYKKATKIIYEIEELIYEVMIELEGNVEISSTAPSSIIKAVSPKFIDDFDTLSEKILEYFKLVYEYEGKKLFITINLRSYISDNEYELFLKEISKRKIDLILIENKEYSNNKMEKRYIIDKDLCEI